jgi:hypothetical protein
MRPGILTLPLVQATLCEEHATAMADAAAATASSEEHLCAEHTAALAQVLHPSSL